MERKKVVITGATGLIGHKLTAAIKAAGYEVYIMSRKHLPDSNAILWDLKKGFVETEKLKDTYAVIHLAGSGIADGRWTEEVKKEVISSRVDSANLLFTSFKNLGIAPQVFLSASGIGYYGADTGTQLLDENSPKTEDFISIVCQLWEDAAFQFTSIGSRVAILRTGVVLSSEGGALPRLSQTIKYFIGSPIASGKQYMSWLHIDDMCQMYVDALNNEAYNGVYNAVADEPVTNEVFTKEVAKVMKKPMFMPNVPAFVLKLIFGEMASLLIGGNKVSSKKLHDTGFKFKFPKLKEALSDFYK